MVIAIVIGGLVGYLLRVLVFAAIADRPVLTLLVAAIALNLMLTGFNQFIWAEGEPYRFPRALDARGESVLPGLSAQHLLILVTTLVLLAAFAFVLSVVALSLGNQRLYDHLATTTRCRSTCSAR